MTADLRLGRWQSALADVTCDALLRAGRADLDTPPPRRPASQTLATGTLEALS